MSRKSWLQYPPLMRVKPLCSVVTSIKCSLNRGIGCTCGKYNSAKVFTEEERKIARLFDVSKTLADAILERKAARLLITE